MAYTKPLPERDPLTDGYWELARRERLSVQGCRACGDLHFPASPVCPACLSDEQEWVPVSGRGTLVSWVIFHRAYWDGFQPDVPYDSCLVRLEEGPLVISNFAGGLPPDVRCGMALKAVFEPVTETVTLPRFVAEDARA